MQLKFSTSVVKRLELKVRKFLELILTFVEVTGGKLVEEPFWTTPTPCFISSLNQNVPYKKDIPYHV